MMNKLQKPIDLAHAAVAELQNRGIIGWGSKEAEKLITDIITRDRHQILEEVECHLAFACMAVEEVHESGSSILALVHDQFCSLASDLSDKFF